MKNNEKDAILQPSERSSLALRNSMKETCDLFNEWYATIAA